MANFDPDISKTVQPIFTKLQNETSDLKLSPE